MPGLRVGIVGTGGVGIASAGAIVFQGLAGCLTLYDRSGERARGEALDYLHAMPLLPSTDIRGCSFDDIQPEDVMVITVGAHTKSGQSRLDMLQGNLDVMAATAEAIERGGLPRDRDRREQSARRAHRVPHAPMGRRAGGGDGSGTSLDTLRFTELLAQECGVHPRSVHAWVVGEHGDSSVFLFSGARIGAMSLADYAASAQARAHARVVRGIEEDVRSAAYRVRELTGASRHGIGLTVAGLIRCIGREAGTLIPVSVRVADGVCASLPCALGPDGPSEPLFPTMDADEAGRVGTVARRAPQGQQHPAVLTGRHADRCAARSSPSSWLRWATSRSCSSPIATSGCGRSSPSTPPRSGPSLGGVRFWQYDSEHDAMVDALRLSEAMTLKAAMAGPAPGRRQGGGAVGRPRSRRGPPRCCDALGRAIDELGGRYLAAEDVGATTADMDGLARGHAVGHRRRRVARRLGRPVAGHRVRRRARDARGAASTLDGDAVAARSSRSSSGVGPRRRASRASARRPKAPRSSCRTSSSRAPRSLARELGVEHVADRRRARRRRATCSLRARSATCSTTSRSRVCGAARSSAPPTTSSATIGADRSSPRAASCTCRTSSRTPAGSSTSPRSSWATTATARSSTPPRSRRRPRACCRPRPTSASRRCARPSDLARARLAEEGAGRRWEPGDPAAWTNGEPLASSARTPCHEPASAARGLPVC